MSELRRLKVTLVRSPNKRLASHKACVSGLGLRRMNHSVQVEDTPCTRGMIRKIGYMVTVEEV